MKAVRLTLSLALFVPCLALLGAAAADTYFLAWGGAAIGTAIGVFFGLALGGALPQSAADYFFGPEESAGNEKRGR